MRKDASYVQEEKWIGNGGIGMLKTKNIQITEGNHNVHKKWTINDIEDANKFSNFKIIDAWITSSVVLVNCGIILYTVLFFMQKCFHREVLDISNITTRYNGSPICAFNAILLCALAVGHNGYYMRTEKMLILSDYIGLQWIDFFIKLSLLVVSILQCMKIDWFIGICCYGYILTFIRVLYLKIKLNKDHPLWKEVQEKWYPNNITHNLVMLYWTIFYYIMLGKKYMYFFICYINEMSVDFQNPEVKNILSVINYSYIMIFDVYWSIRVFNKKITKKNKSFKAQYEKQLEQDVEEYYND